MNEQLLILLIILASSGVLSSPLNRHTCPSLPVNANGTVIPQTCTQDFQPACGHYMQNAISCPQQPCVQEYSNPCQACNDPKIEFYKDGECSSIAFTVDYCRDGERNLKCNLNGFNLQQDPVCGYFFQTNQLMGINQTQVLYSNYLNECFACIDPKVDYVKHEACPFTGQIGDTAYNYTGYQSGFQLPGAQIHTIDMQEFQALFKDHNRYFCNAPWDGEIRSQLQLDCSSVQNSTVCGFENVSGNITLPSFGYNIDNGCLACDMVNISYYINSACGQINPDVDYCSIEEQTNTDPCPSDDSPVYGYFFAKYVNLLNYGSSYQAYNNRCLACQDKQVDYIKTSQPFIYVPAASPFSEQVTFPIPVVYPNVLPGIEICSMNPNIKVLCVNTIQPVCGIYQSCSPTDQICQKTYNNQCLACSDIKVGMVLDGECGQNQSILMHLDHVLSNISTKKKVMCGPICTQCPVLKQPVCAFQTKCPIGTSENCYETKANSCLACQDQTIQFYYDGACDASINNQG